MIAGLPAADWMGVLEQAMEEVAGGAFGCTVVRRGRHGKPEAGMAGAYLGLVGAGGGIQIGVASTPDGCQALSKALLGMEADAPPLGPEEVADAVSEIVNILAGAVKARVRDRVPTMQMGLPTFFLGPLQPTEKLAASVADVEVGGVATSLLLVHPRKEH